MRRRLLAAFVGLTFAMLAFYGIPRAYFLADLIREQQQAEVEQSVELIEVLLAERQADGTAVTASFLASLVGEDDLIEYVDPAGRPVTAGEPVATRPTDVVVTRAVGEGASVTVRRPGRVVEQAVSDALVPLVAIGLGLIVAAAVTGLILAKRLARPFQELATLAHDLGHGKFDLAVPHYSIPEAEDIGAALRTSAQRLRELIRREREFAANASHQLRTPLTALRLELEDLTLWPQTPPEVSKELTEALREIDRLSAAVTEILDVARGQRIGTSDEVDLALLAEEAVERWRPHASRRSRAIVRRGRDRVLARLPAGPIAQILDVLIENALSHGEGTITVSANDVGGHLEVKVGDEGRHALRNSVFARGVSRAGSGGAGLGLAVATELAEAMDGHLVLGSAERTTFTLMLPRPSGRPVASSSD